MRNAILALAFMLMGTFAFANSNINNDKTSMVNLFEAHNLNYSLEGLTVLLKVNSSVESFIKDNVQLTSCEIEIDVVNSNGEVVGTIYITLEVSGSGSAGSAQSACNWAAKVITAILNA